MTLDQLLDQAVADNGTDGGMDRTLAVCVERGGEVVAERYDVDGGVGTDSTLISWSMAKSVTHALVGILVGRGLLDPAAPAAVPEWQGDGRAAITLEHLLRMTDGLAFNEDYVDGATSDTIEMLFGGGADDIAAYARSRPLAHRPGTVWSYSSGTTNVVTWLCAQVCDVQAVLRDDLFGPLGMTSATARTDAAGTFVGSSYVYATARDFARFGRLYLADGVAPDGRRLLPEGWVDHARTATPGSGGEYGAQWWLYPDRPTWFRANGYEGQRIVCVPEQDLVVVRLGKTPVERADRVNAWLDEVVAAAT